MKKYFIYPISLLSVLILSSCGPKIYIPDDTPDLKVQESFLNSNIASFRASDGFINKGLINIAWNENNVLSKENNTLSLQITDNPNNYGGTSYYGGEYHSNDLYSYGDYEDYLKMKIYMEKLCKEKNCSLDDLHYEDYPEEIEW